MSQSLEILNISDKFRDYCLGDFNIQLAAFPKLSSLSISTEISPFTEFENVINVVQVSELKTQVLFDGINVKTCEALLNLLTSLRKMKNIAAGKRVEMVIYAKELDAEEEYFEKNYEDVKKGIGRVKNLFLLIKIRKSGFRFQKELWSFQPLFRDLKVHKALC